jgi:hypothetical protein
MHPLNVVLLAGSALPEFASEATWPFSAAGVLILGGAALVASYFASPSCGNNRRLDCKRAPREGKKNTTIAEGLESETSATSRNATGRRPTRSAFAETDAKRPRAELAYAPTLGPP